MVARFSSLQLSESGRGPTITRLPESPNRQVPVFERNIAGVHHGDEGVRVVSGKPVAGLLENIVDAGTDGQADTAIGQ
jgi:hypothetical protein